MGTTAQIEQFVCWLKSLTHIPLKVVVAGNHEVILHKEFYEKNWERFHGTKEIHEVALDKLKSAGHGIVYLDNESYTVNGAQLLHQQRQKRAWAYNPLNFATKAESMDVDDQIPVGVSTKAESMDMDIDDRAPARAEVDPREGWMKGYHIWASPWQPEFGNWAFNGVRGKLMGERTTILPDIISNSLFVIH